MAKKASSEFHPGIPTPTTPSQGTGSHSPEATKARGITGHPSGIVRVPRMARNSADGVVTRPKRHTSQGWYSNDGVKQVEV
jgi:hypothetical protein